MRGHSDQGSSLDRYIEYEHNKLVLHTFFQKIENFVLGVHSLCIMLSVDLFSRVRWPRDPTSKGIFLQRYPTALISYRKTNRLVRNFPEELT